MTKVRRKDRREARADTRSLLPMMAEGQPVHFRPGIKPIKALNPTQANYIKAVTTATLVFGVGPAGTGKTWIAARMAAEALRDGETGKIFITRPAVEAGEELGFLPGELEEKFEPYFRPVRDALEEGLGAGATEYMIKAKKIEVRPLAYLRGATFKDCWVILDEAQNTTPLQMKLFLARIGENAKIIINGDPSQKDIPGPSGLVDGLDLVEGMADTAVVRFGIEDVVRSGITREILRRYDARGSSPSAERYNAEHDDSTGLRRFLRAG
jgi:phosphate starvation-inducible PhoH-like protein